jgi:hypothetical protein
VNKQYLFERAVELTAATIRPEERNVSHYERLVAMTVKANYNALLKAWNEIPDAGPAPLSAA